MSEAAVPAPLVKPLLRGVSHQVAFFAALAGTAVLVDMAPSTRGAWAAAIYGISLCAMFGTSASYHRPTWQPRARAWMRRADHAAIFVLIAGTYTPFALLIERDNGSLMLWVAWGGALAGVLQSLFWVHAPRPVSAFLYLLLGWASVFFLPRIVAVTGMSFVWLLGGGGLVYSAGAVIYALRRPNPAPKVFGYHEIFHVLVIIAAALHYAAEILVVRRLT